MKTLKLACICATLLSIVFMSSAVPPPHNPAIDPYPKHIMDPDADWWIEAKEFADAYEMLIYGAATIVCHDANYYPDGVGFHWFDIVQDNNWDMDDLLAWAIFQNGCYPYFDYYCNWYEPKEVWESRFCDPNGFNKEIVFNGFTMVMYDRPDPHVPENWIDKYGPVSAYAVADGYFGSMPYIIQREERWPIRWHNCKNAGDIWKYRESDPLNKIVFGPKQITDIICVGSVYHVIGFERTNTIQGIRGFYMTVSRANGIKIYYLDDFVPVTIWHKWEQPYRQWYLEHWPEPVKAITIEDIVNNWLNPYTFVDFAVVARYMIN